MVTFRTTLLIILLLAAARQHAQTTVAGGSVSGTWEADGNPYIIEGNITVDPDERLSLKPGVELYFTGNYSLEVYGRLEADGTPDEKILFSLDDTTGFASGTAGWGGIAFLGYFAVTTENSALANCIIEYSSANGITCLDYDNLVISQTEVRNNRKKGMVLYEFSDIEVHGIHLHHNQTGGMEAQFSGPRVSEFTFEDNGGPGILVSGLSFSGQHAYFENGIIRNNHNTFHGGGLQILMDSYVDLVDVSITDNSAAFGGGVYAYWANTSMTGVEITGNQAVRGGAVYGETGSGFQMEHCLLARNTAEEEGGAFYLLDAGIALSRTTITDNAAGLAGGAIYSELFFNDPGTINSSILWGNHPNEITALSDGPAISYSDVADGYAGQGNINADPLFENAENGNYHLSWAGYPSPGDQKSPCIDAGDPEAAWDGDGTVADMGAYYFNQENITAVRDMAANHFSMYPNPASGYVNLQATDDIARVEVLDISGKVIHILEVGGSTGRVDTAAFPAGICFVRVTLQNGTVTTSKLVIQ